MNANLAYEIHILRPHHMQFQHNENCLQFYKAHSFRLQILASINYSLICSRVRTEFWSMGSRPWNWWAWSRLAHPWWVLSSTSPGQDISIPLSRWNVLIFSETQQISISVKTELKDNEKYLITCPADTFYLSQIKLKENSTYYQMLT